MNKPELNFRFSKDVEFFSFDPETRTLRDRQEKRCFVETVDYTDKSALEGKGVHKSGFTIESVLKPVVSLVFYKHAPGFKADIAIMDNKYYKAVSNQKTITWNIVSQLYVETDEINDQTTKIEKQP